MAKKTVRLPAHIKPEHYKILLKPDLESFTFEGEEKINLILEKSTNQITLHSTDLDIESAEYLHEKSGTWAAKITYDEKAETATFTFPKKLPKGKGQLKLTFKGILNDKMRGFYKSKYTHNGKDKHLATTQFEATDARRAFPCFDEPHQKAIFDVTLMIPPNLTAISNTTPTNVWEHASGYKVWEFEPTPRMSTYLLAFIVGEFEYVQTKTKEGVLVRVFTTPGKMKQAQFALEVASKILSFYEDYFDIAYPLPSLDLIAIPDFAFGAMENWGAITYRESAILVDPQHTALQNKQWIALVIAHELAHQWFGNLVTMEWWTHLWLNEGFASYIEYLALDHLFPQWDIWTQFVYLDLNTALELDGLRNTHPIEVEVHHPSEISEIFDAVSYSKGSSILRMLAQYLGEEKFRDGLRHYLKRHSYANATTADLWKALEEISGKPVEKIMTNWTSQAGYPVIKVKQSKNGLELNQSRFFSSSISKKVSKDKTVWFVPVNVLMEGSKKPTQYLMDKKTLKIDKPKEGGWIKLNSGESSFIRVIYPAKILDLIEKPLRGKILKPVDRLGIIRDAFALAEAGQLPTDQALTLSLSYQDEADYTVWAIISSGLHQILRLLDDDKKLDLLFKAYGRVVFLKIASKMGWEKKEKEKHTDTLLRALALYNLGNYGDKNSIKKAKDLFNQIGKNSKLDPDIRGVVYNLVAENGDKDEYQQMLTLFRKTDLQEEKNRLAYALASFRNKGLIQKTLQFSLSSEVRAQDTFRVFQAVWKNSTGRHFVWEFTKKNWLLLLDRYGTTGHMLVRFVKPIEDFHSQKEALDVELFFKKNSVPSIQRTVAQVLEKIHSNIEWLKRDKIKIKSFLSHF